MKTAILQSLQAIVETDENAITEHISPKCKVAWDQNAPYNRYCFTESGQQALAGCVAIATAQALTVLQPSNSLYNILGRNS